jgi:O-antigen ligase
MSESARVLAVLVAVVASFVWAELRGGSRDTRGFRTASLAWMWLVSTESLLLRTRPADDALLGEFSLAAQSEALSWVIAAVFIALLAIRWPGAFRSLTRPPLRWALCFALLAAISSLWSDSHLYSLIWAGKLLAVVAALGALTTVLTSSPERLLAFVKLAWITFLVASILPLLLTLVDPSTSTFWADEGRGRFGSISLSEAAAVAMLLSIAVADAIGRRYPYLLGAISFVLMFSGIGKTAIIAGLAAVLLYTMATRGRSAALVSAGYAAVAIVLSAAAIAVAPDLGAHLLTYYDQGNASNISGRLPLWEASIGPILERWVLGHGYLSSRFLFTTVSAWGSALPTSLHNAWLEAFYNNGIVGVVVLVVLHVSTIRCLWRAWRRPRGGDRVYRAAWGAAMALYAGSLINAAAGVYFGGAPHKSFVLFLTTVALAQVLAYASQSRQSVETPAGRGEGSSGPAFYRMPEVAPGRRGASAPARAMRG